MLTGNLILCHSHDGGTAYEILAVDMAKSKRPPFALLYLLWLQSDGPSTPQHCNFTWMKSTTSVRDSMALYSLLIVCLKFDFTNDSSLSLFWYAQTPAAISAVTTMSITQKNDTSMHVDSLRAPQHPQNARSTIRIPKPNSMKSAYW